MDDAFEPRSSGSPDGREPPLSDLAEAIVRTIREPLLILDEQFRVYSANPAFYRTFGTTEAESLGRSLFALGDGHWDIPELRRLLEEVLPGNAKVEEFEVQQNFAGIGARFMVVNARRLEMAQGGSSRILIAIQDETETRAARAELLRSNEELERFAYVASHDLQEPLRMVASYTRLLASRYEGRLDSQADRYIRHAVDGAERMKALIQDLLAYSRVGTTELRLEALDVGEALDLVLSDLRMRIARTGARITRGDLPGVLADPGQLRQLLQNLIENALKFSGDGPPVVHVEGGRVGGRVHFQVRDEGIGVAPEYFEKIFILFQRLHGRETEGTGIGLAICQRVVERHGGKLRVESEPGRGTTFHFSLPTVEEE